MKYKDTNNQKNVTLDVIKSASAVMVLLILVKIVGFAKQAVIAYFFGTGIDLDIYFIANNFVTELGVVFFASLSVNFLAIYTKEYQEKGKEIATVFLSNTLVIFIPVAIIISILVFVGADIISNVIAPGYKSLEISQLASNIRILSIVLVNICIGNICTSKLESCKQFLPGKFVGLIQSIVIIAACLLFPDISNVLLYAVIIYYLIQNIYLLICTFKNDKFSPYRSWADKRIAKLILLSVPLFISNGILQINIIANQAIGSYMSEGIVSALTYSHTILSMIHSIFIGSVCTVVLSYFSSIVATGKYDSLSDLLNKILTAMMLICVCVVVIFSINAELVTRIIYGRGAFGEESVVMTAYGFLGYMPGLVFLGLRDILIMVHYAFQDTKNPTINGIIGVFINITISIILAKRLGIMGITLGDTVSYVITFVCSVITVKKHLKGSTLFNKAEVLKICVSGGIAMSLSLLVNNILGSTNIYLRFCIMSAFIFAVMYVALRIFKSNSIIQIENMTKIAKSRNK